MPHDTTSLFNDLLGDWERYRRSPTARSAVRRWRAAEPALAAFTTPEALVEALRDPVDLDRRDERTLALLRLARNDADARRVLLQALWPGLVHLTTLYGNSWNYEDTAATVVLLALERLATYPLHRRTRTAANVIKDVQHGLYQLRMREVRVAASLGQPMPVDEAAVLPSRDERSAVEEVFEILADAMRSGRLSEEDAQLIVERRVLDTPTAVTAARDGRRPSTIRKRRERAEARLACA